jgi:hypothetical protein
MSCEQERLSETHCAVSAPRQQMHGQNARSSPVAGGAGKVLGQIGEPKTNSGPSGAPWSRFSLLLLMVRSGVPRKRTQSVVLKSLPSS